MNYSKSLLLYEDRPAYGLILKIIMAAVPLALLGTALYLWHSGEIEGAAVLGGETVLVGGIFWAVFPRSYRVYDDHLRVALGGPLGINIGFDQIAKIEMNHRANFTVNFVTRITNKYVVIVKKKGLTVAITPTSAEAFVENALNAWRQWEQTRKGAAERIL